MQNKKIHYCWFGGKPLNKLGERCLASWKKYCPEYEIIEWNESNFDIHCCKYVEEAYNAKKWAFVSDYCRFWVLYNFGGIYMDTDVEVIKPLNDLPDNFVGFESKSAVASGLIRGALTNDRLCKLMIDSYNKDKFLLDNGEFNLKTVCARETEILCKYGLVLNGEKQTILETTVFPTDYFCPKDFETKEINITQNTLTIHHYDSSWWTEEDFYKQELASRYNRFLPNKIAARLAYLMTIKKYHGFKFAVQKIFKRLNRKDERVDKCNNSDL